MRKNLPIIPHGSQVRQVKMSMKNSYLWKAFKQYKLTKNMRVIGSGRFNIWRNKLMEIGNGTIETDEKGNILLPPSLVDSDSISTTEMTKKKQSSLFMETLMKI